MSLNANMPEIHMVFDSFTEDMIAFFDVFDNVTLIILSFRGWMCTYALAEFLIKDVVDKIVVRYGQTLKAFALSQWLSLLFSDKVKCSDIEPIIINCVNLQSVELNGGSKFTLKGLSKFGELNQNLVEFKVANYDKLNAATIIKMMNPMKSSIKHMRIASCVNVNVSQVEKYVLKTNNKMNKNPQMNDMQRLHFTHETERDDVDNGGRNGIREGAGCVVM